MRWEGVAKAKGLAKPGQKKTAPDKQGLLKSGCRAWLFVCFAGAWLADGWLTFAVRQATQRLVGFELGELGLVED